MQNTSNNEMKKVVSKLMEDNPKYKENLKDLLSVYLDPYGYIYRTQVYHQLKDLESQKTHLNLKILLMWQQMNFAV